MLARSPKGKPLHLAQIRAASRLPFDCSAGWSSPFNAFGARPFVVEQRASLAAVEPRHSDRSHRQNHDVAPDHFGTCRSGHWGLTGADRSHKRSVETAELPRCLCLNPQAFDSSQALVGPPSRWLALRRISEQCSCSKAALCQHRRVGELG